MSHGFDKALITRERNREELSAVLDEKFQAEARVRNIKRGVILVIATLALIQVARGGMSAVRIFKKLDPGAQAEALQQMKKQLKQSDQMMISARQPASAPPVPTAPRSRGERKDFGQEQIPMHLYGELSKKPEAGKEGSKEYGPPGESEAAELEKIKSAREKNPKIDCAQYRQLEISDMPKLPPVVSRRVASASKESLYERLENMPARLAADTRGAP